MPIKCAGGLVFSDSARLLQANTLWPVLRRLLNILSNRNRAIGSVIVSAEARIAAT
jgi:hypothetical protein